MKRLPEMYDLIFQDSQLKKLFLNFHSFRWKKLSIEDKLSLMNKINDRVASIYGYKPPIIKHVVEKKNYGSFGAFYWKLFINERSLMYDNGYEVIDTYFHELRHSFQYRAIANELTDKEYADKKDVYNWKRNFFPGNYFGGEEPFYINQPVEIDAWTTGMLFAQGVHKLCSKHFKREDPEWEKYCSLHKNVIVDFISENKESVNRNKMIQDQIDEIYDSREVDNDQIEMGKKFIESLKDKNIKDLSFNEVGILLSPYAFVSLDTFTKVAVLNKYISFIKAGKRTIKIEENTTESIKLGRDIYTVNSSLHLVNAILTKEFSNIVYYVLTGKDTDFKLDKIAKRDLKLNLYKGKNVNKNINFVKDRDNLFFFSLQPYAKYESEYILGELKKLKEIEYSYFKKNSQGWELWENFYDNDKIYAGASKLYDLKFEIFYDGLLRTYKDRIKREKDNLLELSDDISKEIQIELFTKLALEKVKEIKDDEEFLNNQEIVIRSLLTENKNKSR